MTDLSSLSNEELLSMYALPALIDQESGGRAGVVGPQTKWGQAKGRTQLLDGTAQEMAAKVGLPYRPELLTGTTPDAIDYQDRLGQAYLQEGLEKTGSLEGAFKYYHGGPNQKQWGPKTEQYAQAVMTKLNTGGEPPAMPADLSQLSDQELLAMYQQTAPQQPAPRTVAASRNGGVTIEVGGEMPPAAPQQVRPPIPRKAGSAPTQNPTIAQDAWSGFAEPFKALGGAVMDRFNTEKAQALAGPPASAGEALKRTLGGLGSMAGIGGDVLGLLGAPVQAVVRPTARAVNRLPITPYVQDSPFVAPRPAQGEEAQALIEGSINKALSAARPIATRPPAPVKTPAPTLDELRAAKSAAYDAVDNAGVRFWPQETDRMLGDMRAQLQAAGIDPVLNQKAARTLDILEQRKGQAPTLSEVDKMRQIISREVSSAKEPGEQMMGGIMKGVIDDFLDNVNPAQVVPNASTADPSALIRSAREANRRYRNVQKVTDRTRSAELRAATTYAGGNQANAARQNLRPLLDPTSSQRLKGLKPAEIKALNQATEGTAAANAARSVGKLLDPRGLLGAVALGPLGIPTAGAAPAVGALSSAASNALTNRSIKKLVEVLAKGGQSAQAAISTPNAVSLFSLPGAVGASELAAPLARIPSAPSKKSGPTKEPVRPRKK